MTKLHPKPRQNRFRFGVMTAATLAFSLLSSPCAYAQTMDYGSLEELFGEPGTTSATGSPLRATDAPANMTIVTANEIRRSGARDIPGVLRHVAGVDVLQWAADDFDVSIRGYDQAYAARTLVLVNGRQVYADYFGFVPWSALPVQIDAIRQIEIVKGPNAALFGFNAVGGVINIITYNSRYDDVNVISGSVGSQGLGEITGVAMLKAGPNASFRVMGGYRIDNDFAGPVPPGASYITRKNNSRASIDFAANFSLGHGVELDVETSHTHSRVNEVSPDYVLQNSLFETNSVEGHIGADTDLGLLKLTGYTNWISWKGMPSPVFGAFALQNAITNIQAEDVFTIGSSHTIRLAEEYRHSSVNTTPLAGGTISYDVISSSVMWSWQIRPTVSLTNAVRYDHLLFGRSGTTPIGYPFTNEDWDRRLDEVSFNSGLVWNATLSDTIRFIVSRGVQLPSLVESGALLISSPYITVSGSPKVKPTSVMNYEITWNHNLAPVDARLQLEAFHQESRNIAAMGGEFVTTSTAQWALATNIGTSEANGFEASIVGRLSSAWHWSVNYRFETISDKFIPIADHGNALVEYQHTTPKSVLKAGLGWNDEDWETDAYFHYQTDTSGLRLAGVYTHLVPLGDYTTLDARIAYRLMDCVTLAISGQNLLSSAQRQTSGPYVERQVFITATFHD